ncbi:hypothetical protein JOE69_001011 [Arthrobacter russicus]|uniref:LPXTG cell wall anchor domain-containing protein n=1 Tax=Arthrobacter russicus TaxID=172040 RepID=A0ABU1J8M9_9MICC|nr:hypothetical protein [Arthrobacter russicus]
MSAEIVGLILVIVIVAVGFLVLTRIWHRGR